MDRNALRKATLSCVVDIAIWMAVLMVLSLFSEDRSFGDLFLSPVNLVLMAAGILGGAVYVYVNEARPARGKGRTGNRKKR